LLCLADVQVSTESGLGRVCVCTAFMSPVPPCVVVKRQEAIAYAHISYADYTPSRTEGGIVALLLLFFFFPIPFPSLHLSGCLHFSAAAAAAIAALPCLASTASCSATSVRASFAPRTSPTTASRRDKRSSISARWAWTWSKRMAFWDCVVCRRALS
jgi:hypothetical protein